MDRLELQRRRPPLPPRADRLREVFHRRRVLLLVGRPHRPAPDEARRRRGGSRREGAHPARRSLHDARGSIARRACGTGRPPSSTRIRTSSYVCSTHSGHARLLGRGVDFLRRMDLHEPAHAQQDAGRGQSRGHPRRPQHRQRVLRLQPPSSISAISTCSASARWRDRPPAVFDRFWNSEWVVPVSALSCDATRRICGRRSPRILALASKARRCSSAFRSRAATGLRCSNDSCAKTAHAGASRVLTDVPAPGEVRHRMPQAPFTICMREREAASC